MKKLLLLVLSISIILSCTKENKLYPEENYSFTELQKSAPSPDHSTPESLIISLWKYKLWSDTVFVYDTTLSINRFYSDAYYSNQQEKIRNRINEIKKVGHYTDQNKILKTEMRSDSFAVLSTNELSYPSETNLTEFRYELIRTNKGWVINDCLKQCAICDGSGKDTFDKNKNCKYCNGIGWTSISAY